MCLAKGHNTVKPVRLKLTALRSRVKHSTTEPLPFFKSYISNCVCFLDLWFQTLLEIREKLSAYKTQKSSQNNQTKYMYYINTPDRWQSKTPLTIDERGSKISRNSIFHCHLSPIGQKMAMENSVSNYFWSKFMDSIDIFHCHLSGVRKNTQSAKQDSWPTTRLA